MLHAIEDAGQPGEVDIGQAARILGTTPAALRKRIRRGTLAATKRAGLWYVTLPGTSRQTGRRTEDAGPDTERPTGQPGDSPLVDTLRDEVQWLRRENERKDMIIAAFAGRLPELLPADTVAAHTEAPPPTERKRRGFWAWLRAGAPHGG
jgi:hypothetical protein